MKYIMHIILTMNSEQLFKLRLQKAGERVTTPRLAVFRQLVRHAPVSPSVLMSTCQADGLDTVTVYRTLALFRRLGLVVELGLGRHRFLELGDDYHAHHHHFTCSNCGNITDFNEKLIEEGLARISQQLGATIQSHQLELVGLCTKCQSSSDLKLAK